MGNNNSSNSGLRLCENSEESDQLSLGGRLVVKDRLQGNWDLQAEGHHVEDLVA